MNGFDEQNTTDDKELSNEAIQWIVRLNSGSARPEDWQAFGAWRSSSFRHEQAAIDAERLWSDMSDLHHDNNSGFVRPGARPQKAPISRRTVLACLATVGGSAMTGGFWIGGNWQRLSADYTSDVATPRTIDLPDGSRAFLNASSAINLKFNAAHRQIALLEGQCYFEVAADTNRPFEVLVDDISVVALGTAFDVNRNLPDLAAEIAVTEHSVRIRSHLSKDTALSMAVLKAGESVTVDRRGEIGSIVDRATGTISSWRNGTYVAEDRPLSEVVAALDAYHQGFIVIADAHLKTLRINAVLDLRDPIGSLETLQQGLPLKISRASNYFVIISAT